MIIVQGKADRLVDPSGAQMLYDKSSSTDKTLKMYDVYTTRSSMNRKENRFWQMWRNGSNRT